MRSKCSTARLGATILIATVSVAMLAAGSTGPTAFAADSPVRSQVRPAANPPLHAVIVSNHSGTDSVHACSQPAYTSIQTAVTAASPNSTIYVCAGTYTENVSINQPLVLDGANFGESASTRSGPETVIAGSDGVSYATGATTGTFNGFTVNGCTSCNGGRGEIVASNVGAGWTFTDNIIDVSNGGIYLNTDGQTNPPATKVEQNKFVQATPSSASSGYSGQAVVLWANTANNVTIAKNDFLNLTGPGAAINTTQAGNCGATPDPAKFGNNLAVNGNTFVNNAATATNFYEDNFLALFCTTNANVTDNSVTIADPNDGNASTAIYLGGGDWSTTLSHNTLKGNGANEASGINSNSDFYPAGTDVTITNNTVSGFLYGIHVRSGEFGDQSRAAGNAPSYFTISRNRVSHSSSYGIAINQGLYGTISSNVVMSSATYDCYDATGPGGPGTQGTYNTWSHNSGHTRSPAELCQG